MTLIYIIKIDFYFYFNSLNIMLIPVKCFSCGLPIAHKYEKYIEMKKDKNKDFHRDDIYIFKKLRIKRYCCKRMLMTNVDLVKQLK